MTPHRVQTVIALSFAMFFPALLSASPGETREEKVVRTIYSKLAYLTQLDPVSRAAAAYYRNSQKVDQDSLNRQVEQATLGVTLDNFKVGPYSEVMNERCLSLYDIPISPKEVVELTFHRQTFTDEDSKSSEWLSVTAHWGPPPPLTDAALNTLREITVMQTVAEAHKNRPSAIEYSSYARFTVTLHLQGRKITYRAMYLFGKDKNEEKATPVDLFLTTLGIDSGVPENLYPSGLLHSRLKNVPILANWLSTHTVADESCRLGSNDFCCDGMKCGVSASDLHTVN